MEVYLSKKNNFFESIPTGYNKEYFVKPNNNDLYIVIHHITS